MCVIYDLFYILNNILLRIYNIGIIVYELEKNVNKCVSIFLIGKVYRNDEDDVIYLY